MGPPALAAGAVVLENSLIAGLEDNDPMVNKGAGRFKWLILGIALSVSSSSGAPTGSDQQKLTLQEAIRLSLKHHPGFKAARHSVDAAQWRVKKAYFDFLPKLALDLSYSRYDAPTVRRANILTEIGRNLTRQFAPDADPNEIRPVLWRNAYGTAITLQQPVFNGGALRAQLTLAQANDLGVRGQFQETRQRVILETMQAYFNLIKARELLILARKAVEATRSRLSSIQRMFETGMQNRAEVLRWEVNLASEEGKLVQAESGFALALRQLSQWIGLPLDSSVALEYPDPAFREPLKPLDYYLNKGRFANPALKTFSANIEAQRAQVQLVRSKFFPQVNFFYNYQWETNDTPALDSYRSWTFGFAVRVPVFNSFADYAQLQEARAQFQQIQAAHQELQQSVELQIQQAYYQVQAALKRMALAEKGHALARENFRVVSDMFDVGMATNHELMEAQIAMQKAESDLIEARFDYLIYMARLKSVAGILDVPED